ncbi:MAG: Gfo/Idh/MocA family oxidoreductase [Hyphomicrobiales bacterium]
MKEQGKKNFALIGAAGYIAVRHMKAVKDLGHNITAVLDKFDSVGIIDSYFPQASFFLEPERFDRHLYKLYKEGKESIDYVSICSPNYLHDAHIRLALRNHSHAICEKPLVLNPWNLDALQEVEKETNKNIYTILQLRLHPAIIELKKQVENNEDKIYDVDLSYITSRGKWYGISWKGDESKSGGVATNIGIHFFDMLMYIFGDVKKNIVHIRENSKIAGYLELEKARVRWFLSIDENDLPLHCKDNQQRTFRSITVEDKEIEFSNGFTDLHTQSYDQILKGNGYGIRDAYPSVQLVHDIRNIKPIGLKDDYHPLIQLK